MRGRYLIEVTMVVASDKHPDLEDWKFTAASLEIDQDLAMEIDDDSVEYSCEWVADDNPKDI